MRILSANVTNFASYKELAFDFTTKRLTLVSGPTGSGKSTLCDIIPWILFGRTAKDGATDDIRAWNAEGSTTGIVYIRNNNVEIQIVRKRKPNDLYFIYDEIEHRGKDLNDTQRLLNEFLGISYETYLAAAYFHEFSQTASFFIAPAKARRAILEQLVDLSLAKMLTEKAKNKSKETASKLSTIKEMCQVLRVELAETEKQYEKELARSVQWDQNHASLLRELADKEQNFETEKLENLTAIKSKWILNKLRIEADIQELTYGPLVTKDVSAEMEQLEKDLAALGDAKCSTCGAPRDTANRLRLIKRQNDLQRQAQERETAKVRIESLKERLKTQEETIQEAIQAEVGHKNPYTDQLGKLTTETNQHKGWALELESRIVEISARLTAKQTEVDELLVSEADLQLLQELIEDSRAIMVKNTILQLENETNRRLTDYFNAEIRVQFEVADKDKVEIQITKDGNPCSYAQLSKGQRGMLKLCFGTAVMKTVQERSSVALNVVFLDEALDGLDDGLKSQSFGLLQELAVDHESVFVVEHNESLKAMFPNRLEVSLRNGHSILS